MKTCPSCNTSFEPRKHFNSTIKSKYCDLCTKTRQALKNLERIKKEDKKRFEQKKKDFRESDIKYWLKKAKEACHEYIRLRDKDKGCISCGKPLVKGNTDAGHMWSSHSSSYIRYNEFNINGQCSRPCNKDLSGDTNNYRINFVKRYSKELLEELDSVAHLEKKWTREELKEIQEIYKAKIKNLK